MPNHRTTIIKKMKAHSLKNGDYIKIGGRWYTIERNDFTLSGSDRRHIYLYPENSDNHSERVSLLVNPLVKFKARIPK
jgi:hypothetical protein